MKKWVELAKQHRTWVLWIELAVCILVLIGTIGQKKTMQELLPAEGELMAGSMGSQGEVYIDSTSEFGGPFLHLQSKQLPAGNYVVQIKYETDYDDNGVTISSTNASHGAINTDIDNNDRPVALKSIHQESGIHAWMKQPGALRITLRYCGAGSLKIQQVRVVRTPNFSGFFLMLLVFGMGNVWLHERERYGDGDIKRRRTARAGILLITIMASIPLGVDYLIQGTDMTFHLYRIEGIAQGLRSGQFPVRIHPNWWNEFGYGTPLFYPDFFLYVPGIMTLLGFSLQVAYKCYIIGIHLLTAGITYHCMYKITKKTELSLLAAFLYTLNLYRLMDIYMRGAVGEFTALTFLPLILYGLYELKESNSWLYLALGVTGCIQSHVLTCEMLLIFLLVFCIFGCKYVIQKTALMQIIKAVGATILWNLWFILPFLNLLGAPYQVNSGGRYVGNIQGRGTFVTELFKLFINGLVEDKDAGSGISGEMGHSIGLALGLGLGMTMAIYYIYRSEIWKKHEKIARLGIYAIGLSILALILSTNSFPYDMLQRKMGAAGSLISHIQFPWRFLGFATVFTMVATVVGLYMWEKTEYGILLILLTLVGMSAFYHEMLSKDTVTVKHHEYQAIARHMDQTEYLLEGTDADDVAACVIPSSETLQINGVEKNGCTMGIDCSNTDSFDQVMDLPLFFYPCYQAKISATGQILPITYGENQRIRVTVPAGFVGHIEVKVRERTLWRLANIISLLSVVAVLFYKRMTKQVRNVKHEVFDHNSQLSGR